MLKLFLTLHARLRRFRKREHAICDWRRDPLGHPALAGMDQRTLADLPFDHGAFEAD